MICTKVKLCHEVNWAIYTFSPLISIHYFVVCIVSTTYVDNLSFRRLFAFLYFCFIMLHPI